MVRRFLIALLACPTAALAVDPGHWEMSLVTLMTGQPKPAAVTQARCISEADARDPSRVLSAGGSCTFTNRNGSGGVFTFEIACGAPLPMKGKGRVEYTAQTMDADLDLTAGDGGGFGMRTFVKGRRLGPC